MRIKKPVAYIFFTLFILGILVGLQVKSIYFENKDTLKIQERKNSLLEQIDTEKNKSSQLKIKLKQLENENKNLYDTYTSNSASIQGLKTQYNTVLKYAGLTDVAGPGIVIKLQDANIPPEERKDLDPNWFVIHDSDLYTVINELRANGAEAISINDERVISTSAQVCAGPTVMINGRKYISPFVIRALGNSDMLYRSFTDSKIFRNLKSYSIPITVEKSEWLMFGKYIMK